MTKKKLARMLRDLEAMDAETLAFDHEEAIDCRSALVTLAQKALQLVAAIKIEDPRQDQISHAEQTRRNDESFRAASNAAFLARPQRKSLGD
jgi:hypothetical protein